MDESAIPKSVQEIAEHYSTATQIRCTLIDTVRKKLFDCPCPLCHLIDPCDSVWIEKCTDMHLYNARMAERFGGSFIYFCPRSLLYWVSPVIMEGKMEYAIIAGPACIFEKAELLDELSLTDPSVKEKVQQVVAAITCLPVHRIHSLSEVLRMCAGWASGYAEHQMVERSTSLQLQGRLSEYIQELKRKKADGTYYPFEKEEELQDAIRWGDRPAAQKVMNELLGMIFFSSGNSLDKITFRVMELILLFARAAIQGGAPEEEIMQISYRCQREIGRYTNLDSLAQWLAHILHQYSDLVFSLKDKEYGPMLAKAIRYIRNHYEQNISLEETASAVSLSPNYFSKIFNEKVGVSFSSYVNRLRVEKARRLLLSTRLSLVEISGLVGFEDQSYFSKVFKSVTDLSPGQYRKRAQRFPTDTHEIHA